MAEDIIQLQQMKMDWYEKNLDIVNIHLYVRDVEELEILFEKDRIIVNFSTRHRSFLKQHAKGRRDKCAFRYTIRTRSEVDPSGCQFKVKPPFVELLVKKKIPVKWGSLERLEINEDHVKPAGKKTLKPPTTSSPTKSQLLGGKSTPNKSSDDGKQDTEVNMENMPSSSKSEDRRNNQKRVTLSQTESSSYSGLTGLENYANNCYMNVVLQVLANIQETRDYFKNDHYLKDISSNNPLGSGGKVAKGFADVTKALWSHTKKAFKPTALKNIMGKRCTLFLGWQQHDAQEFFGSLLDNLHEDLNQSNYEKVVEKEVAPKPDGEPSVNEKPDTAWSAHLKRNNSMIIKLFHGQLISKLTCAACHKISYSYDPCAQISLPIPTTKQVLKVLLFTRDVENPPFLITLQVSTPNAQIWHLVNMLQAAVKIPAHLIALFNGVSDICVNDQAPLTSVSKNKYIIASEISSKDETDFFSIPAFQYLLHAQNSIHCENCFKSRKDATNKLKRCTRCLAAAYCSRDCQLKHWQLHSKVCSKDLKMQAGLPFYVTLRKDTLTFDKLEEILRERAQCSIDFHPSRGREEETKTELLSVGDKPTETENKTKLQNPPNYRFLVKLSSKLNVNDEACTPLNSDNFSVDAILKSSCMIMEWQNSPPEDGVVEINDIQERDVPVYKEFDTEGCSTSKEEHCSLYDCVRLFMEPERLDESESWKCPKCKSLQAAKKEMAISSPPPLLLLHFKRFTYGEYGQKISKAVSYPLSNFDVGPYVAKETRSRIDFPLVYDLCSVITHRGTMRMGHYTCMVRMLNQLDQEEVGWRHFDDDYGSKIREEKVVSPDAYVLVYRIHGAQEIIKADRSPVLSTSSATSSTENVVTSVKRRRADSVATCGKSNPDRRSASESTLNRMKRSTSTEATCDERTNKNSFTGSPSLGLRRCASAVPIEHAQKTKKSSAIGQQNTLTGSLPDVTHHVTCTSDCDNRRPTLSSSSDEYVDTYENLGGNESPSDSIKVCCDSFDDLCIDPDLEKSLGDIEWTDSEQFLTNEHDSFYEPQSELHLDDEPEHEYKPIGSSQPSSSFKKEPEYVDENDLD